MRGFLLLIVATLIVSSASAANDTVQSYIINDQPYTPYPVFVITLALGLLFLILSLILSGDQNNDAFAALAIIPLFASSWMALQLDFTSGGVTGTATSTVMRSDHNIFPSAVLAIIIFSIGCVAVYQLYRLMTQNNSDDSYGYRYADED
jgi:hypothetical protein